MPICAYRHECLCNNLCTVGTNYTVLQFVVLYFFCTGYTDDFHEMLRHLIEKHPNTKVICVGYSMGGNIVTKYMGEERTRPSNLIGGISICQGYDAIQ